MKYSCIKCKSTINTGFGFVSFNYIGNLGLKNINDKDILNAIGQVLDLKLTSYIAESGNEIYYYSLIGQYSHSAAAFSFNCEECDTKYLGCCSILVGDSDRTPESDRIYIENIVAVEINGVDLLKL